MGIGGRWGLGTSHAGLNVTSREAGVTPFGEAVDKQFLYPQEH